MKFGEIKNNPHTRPRRVMRGERKTMRLKPIVAGIFLTLAIPATSFADMACGKVFIHVGDSATKVIRHCGKPHDKTISKIGLSAHEEIWHYAWSNRLPCTLTIRDGRVVKIEND